MSKARLYIGLLIISVLLAGAASALTQPESSFEAIHFVEVTVSAPLPTIEVENRDVVIYKSELTMEVSGTTEVDGKALLNAYRLKYFFGEEINAVDDYYAAVYRGADNYGASPEAFNLALSQGFTQLTLNLAYGQGPIEEVGEGAVILSIVRESDTAGSSIKISWQINTADFPDLNGSENVDIYYMKGNGSGEYTDEFLTKVISNSGLDLDFTVDDGTVLTVSGENAFRWYAQVGEGEPEIYFKGCLAGQAADPDYGLAKAVAVGKFDIGIAPGLANLIALPLDPSDWSLDNVIGTQLSNGDSITTHVMGAGGGSWPESLLTNGKWEGTVTSLSAERGYWINAAEGKTLTVVGKVLNTDQAYSVEPGLANLKGSPYPKTVQIFPVDPLGLGSVVLANGRVTTFIEGAWPESVFDGTNWSGTMVYFQPARGFWIDSANPASATWTYPKPY